MQNIKNSSKWNHVYNIKTHNSLWIKHDSTNFHLKIWLFSISFLLILIFTSYLDNSLLLKNGRGLFQDYIFLSLFIFFPSVISLSFFYFPQINSVLQSLVNVIDVNESVVKDNVQDGQNITFTQNDLSNLFVNAEKKILGKEKYRYIKFLFVFMGLIWSGFGAFSHFHATSRYGFDIWSSQNNLISFYARTIFDIIFIGFILPSILFKFVMILVSMKSITSSLTNRGVIKLRPLNPDKAGGLGEMGKYSLKLIFFLLPPLIPMITYLYIGGVMFQIVLGFTLYIPLLIFTFFFPLSGAHEAMRRFKHDELKILSEKFNEVYDKFIRDIQNPGVKQLPEDFELLRRLDELYKKTESMPVWPFDIKTLTKFGTILAAIITSIWLNWLFGKLVQL